MDREAKTLVLGLAAAIGTALVVFSRKHGFDEPVELADEPSGRPVDRALTELYAWRGLTEEQPAAKAFLAKYWRAAGMAPQTAATPWSAAFISYLTEPWLTPSGSHVQYARAAYEARRDNQAGKYWTFRPEEVGAIRAGDILLKGRGESLDFEDLQSPGGFIKAHGDLVVDANAKQARTVGGNLSNSVRMAEYPLTNGSPGPEVVAVLRRPTSTLNA